jgi:hypothetical protein
MKFLVPICLALCAVSFIGADCALAEPHSLSVVITDSAAGAPSPREATKVIPVTTANVAVVPASYSTPTSGRCTVASTTGVYFVEETAADISQADGPYCTTCTAGATRPIAGRVWARTSSGSTSMSCAFVDAGTGYSSAGGGASGISESAADARYVLKAGDTMTGTLVAPRLSSPQTTSATGVVSLLDTGGAVELVTTTTTTAAAGLTMLFADEWVGPLAAADCDDISETGQIRLASVPGTHRIFCVCEQVTGVIAWRRMSGSAALGACS